MMPGEAQATSAAFKAEEKDTARLDAAPHRAAGPRAVAPAALTRRKRVPWRMISYLLVSAVPTAVAGAYLYGFASDQYVSEFRFTVRQTHPPRLDNSSSLGASVGGGNPLVTAVLDSEIVVQYLQSRQILDDIRNSVDLDAVYARPEADWMARLDPAAPMETRLRYWRRMVDPFFDMSTGLVTVKVRAFSREDAAAVASQALALSERLVNEMSERSRRDSLAYADREVAQREAALRRAEVDLREFRNAHSVAMPALQAGESTTVHGRLREGLAEARATLTSLRAQGVAADSPQARALRNRIAGLEAEAASIQTQVGAAGPAGAEGATLATVFSRYSELDVEAKIAERSYERALGTQQQARSEAERQQIYLNAFVRPALPDESLYPQRSRLLLMIFLGGSALWCLLSLLYHGVREHME